MSSLLSLSPAAQAYLALVLGVWAGSIGIPIPEELPLLTAGVLTALGVIDLPGAIAVGIFACFSGDLAVFTVARKVGSRLDRHPRMKKMLRGRHARRARHLYIHRGPWTLFVARLLPGLKMPFLFTAGAFRMPWRRFIVYDLGSVLVLVPTLTLVAHHSSRSLGELTRLARDAGLLGAPLFLLLLAALVGGWLLHRRRRRRGTAGGADSAGPSTRSADGSARRSA